MKSEIKIKAVMDGQTVSGVLEDLARSFKGGTVCIEKNGEFVTLKPGANITVEIEASQKKNKQKLAIEFTWQQAEPVVKTEFGFKISSEEPEIEAPVPEEDQENRETPAE